MEEVVSSEESAKVLKDPYLERYAVGEHVLLLMREFVGDPQKKAEYLSRIKLLKKFIKDPKDNLGDKRLKEINTLLETFSGKSKEAINRQAFLKEQLAMVLHPSADISSLPTDLVHARLFPHLTLRELENYAASSERARAQVNKYYEFLFKQANLADDKLILFQLVLERNENVIYDFLIEKFPNGKIPPVFFEPINGFDPLLYLHIHEDQGLLYRLDICMKEWIDSETETDLDDRSLRKFILRIRTNQTTGMDWAIVNDLCPPHSELEKYFRNEVLALAVEYKHATAVRVICLGSGMLHECINGDDVEQAKKIIGYGVKPEDFLYEWAIRTHKNNVAKYLVDQMMEHVLTTRGVEGDIFECVCKVHNIEMLRYLCEKVRNHPDLKEIVKNELCSRSAALAYACRWGNEEAVTLLLELGFLPNVCTREEGAAAFDYACKLENRDSGLRIVELMFTKSPGQDASFPERYKILHFGRRSDMLDSLEKYVAKYSKRKTARRLLGVFNGSDSSPFTWYEKLHLNIASFFETELGKLYTLAKKFLNEPRTEEPNRDPEGNPVQETQNESTPLLSSTVSSPSSSKRVMEQVGWVQEMFEEPKVESVVEGGNEFEDETAFFERRDSFNIENNNNPVETPEEHLKKAASPG